MYLDMDLHVKKYACQSFDSTVTCVHIEINFFDWNVVIHVPTL